MSRRKQRSSVQQFKLQALIFFRQFPAMAYFLKWTFVCSLIGICIGSACAAFLHSLDWATNFRESHLWIIWLLPLAGFGIGWLYFHYGKGTESGNNLIIDTIRQPKAIIPFRMAPLVYIGTIATHLFGGSAGREGTALQMAGAIADPLSKRLKLNNEDRKTLLIAAVAAGFGAVFGTPLAGAIFALEFTLIGRLRYVAIFPALLAAFIADLVAATGWGAYHTPFLLTAMPSLSLSSNCYAIIAGALFGICARTFCVAMHKVSALFKSTISYPPYRPLIGGVIIALAVGLIGTTKYIGLGVPTIVDAFYEPLPTYDFALKIAFTVLTLSAGFKGGEVTPLFFIGATLGNALAFFLPLPIALLAGMGFVAVFAGATNTPLACTVMAMELFGIEIGIYAGIACITAYFYSGNYTIYASQFLGNPKHILFSNLQQQWVHFLFRKKKKPL